MKVSLAAQTLSRSVADALRYLRIDIKHSEFVESLATEEFILKINRVFDILYSKNPFARGDCAPLRESTENVWRPFLEEMVDYLLRCTHVGGRPLYVTPHKPPFKGLCITVKSVIVIFDQYVKTKKQLRYILTLKLSQDHLETLFCAIRSRNGWNNNPSPLQFKYALRRILLHKRVGGHGGKCRVIDSTVVLSVSSKVQKSVELIDISVARKYGLNIENLIVEDNEYNVTNSFIPLSEISSHIVVYMPAYVIKMLIRRNICPECLDDGAFKNDNIECGTNGNYKFIHRKNRGGFIKICTDAEKIIRKLMALTDNKLPKKDNFQQSFIILISQKFYEYAFPKTD